MKAQLNQMDPNQLLKQFNRLSDLASSGANQKIDQGENTIGDAVAPVKSNEFNNLLTKAIDTVNQYQQEAGQAARQIEMGDGGVSLVKAMIASQKSSVAFQSTLQVRNKLVSAYQDIMNMPI